MSILAAVVTSENTLEGITENPREIVIDIQDKSIRITPDGEVKIEDKLEEEDLTDIEHHNDFFEFESKKKVHRRIFVDGYLCYIEIEEIKKKEFPNPPSPPNFWGPQPTKEKWGTQQQIKNKWGA